jgi:hypothetical protein
MSDVNLTAVLEAKINGFEKNINSATRTIINADKQIDTAVGAMNKSIAGINPASKTAAFALTNLGRVAQDAPFGFIAIQNNIGPLIDSFGYLAKEAKETGTSITSALVGSLTGPAGLGLAISLVTAGLTLYIQHQQAAAKAVNDAKKSTDDYIATLDEQRAASVKGAQNAQSEITRLKILYHATQDSTLSRKQRNLAYDELERKYPQFFTNAEREKTLLGENSTGYLQLANSILAAARARAYEQRITENTNRQITDAEKILDLTKQEIDTRAKLNAAQKQLGDNSNVQALGSGGISGSTNFNDTATQQRVNSLQGDLNKIIQQKNNLLTDTSKLELNNLRLSQEATKQEALANFKSGGELDDNIKKTKQQKKTVEQLYALHAGSPNLITDTSNTQAQAAAYKELQDSIGGVLDPTRQFILDQYNLQEQTQKTVEQFKAQDDVTNQLAFTIGSGLTDAFAAMLTGGKNAFSQFGQLILQLIAKVVAATIAAAALAALLSVVFPGYSIASGASNFSTLLSGLSGISSLGKAIPGFATGGLVTGPTLAMVGEGGQPEVIAPKSQFDALMDSRNYGGGDLVATTKVQGQDILLVIQRAQKSQKRTS